MSSETRRAQYSSHMRWISSMFVVLVNASALATPARVPVWMKAHRCEQPLGGPGNGSRLLQEPGAVGAEKNLAT
jgi:hypothetical protein